MRDFIARTSIALIISCAFLTNGAAQTNATTPSQDDKIKALEERIIAMEGEIRMLKAAQTQAAPAAAPAPAAAAAVAPPSTAPPEQAGAAGTEAAGQLPVYGGATGQAK